MKALENEVLEDKVWRTNMEANKGSGTVCSAHLLGGFTVTGKYLNYLTPCY